VRRPDSGAFLKENTMSEQKHMLKQIASFIWQVPQDTIPGMRVPGEIIASPEMISHIYNDNTPKQVANVATLPGIIRASMAMPDIHWGYGFPIGGVAAFDLDEGIISPGGVGYDINCGVTLVRSDLTSKEIRPRIKRLIDALFYTIPCGVGSEGRIKLSAKDFNQVLQYGAGWVVKYGLADKADPLHMEENGAMKGGDPSLVSERAGQRAQKQLGTLGSGNHFIEVQEVEEIFLPDVADAFGLFKGQAVVMIHSGSRGLGHQICDDSLKVMQQAVRKYEFDLPDRQLACAPFQSPEGQDYFSVMKCAANYAWANRLTMVGLTREVFGQFFGKSWQKLGMSLVYDVCHNIAKVEEFDINDFSKIDNNQKSAISNQKSIKVCVHRKGATRALGPGDVNIPDAYRDVGQPVLIPGDMGRASYVLVGTKEGASISFSSTCHGAGRVMSRKAAVRKAKGQNVAQRLAQQGITVRSRGKMTLLEEVPEAYKDVTEVVKAVDGAGVSRPVARLRPIGTIKG